ncbi:small ribosomal subunit protein uS11m [Planococcus citri]|uniref:small ribosomal subunit protein uS11m n=1 Tax=Planococcus citri TaxID=170843 RepID=UPI0031F8EEE7
MLKTCVRSLILNSCNSIKSNSPFLKSCNLDVNHLNSHFNEFHVSVPRNTVKPRDRKDLLRGAGKIEEGTEGEYTESLDTVIKTREDMFIDERTPDLLFNGVRWAEIPICNIHVTKNNTIINVSNFQGKTIVIRSCGMEGFKNCRKGTNIAAQTTALAVSQKCNNIGVKDVRVKVNGLGPGRMASIKGLQMGGLNIVSITDDTRVPWKLRARPKKQRRT